MQKEPLYRKVNTKARNVHHAFGGDYRHERNTKNSERSEATRGSMHGKHQRGLDYTPLFRFLLSKIGADWDSVHSEAVSRLDRPEPIFWLVALRTEQRQDVVRIGDSSYYSGLFVDDEGKLQVVNPTLGPERMTPSCPCCTHTFNGVRFGGYGREEG
ncbi:hypothetical protein EJP67_21380 [Variovorax guangxiensis]|uniref:Uncharacterized protein n=1 Tax=Variovorax guangxiensis TaxID=1775474 RepID=A0A433MNK8_9BURK|nr:hypothetical protein [Variovorax guangxiensis]RUR69611.1 hypothetical protein EJP67_21380 [Variovorax guangxiensis]